MGPITSKDKKVYKNNGHTPRLWEIGTQLLKARGLLFNEHRKIQ